MSKPVSETGRRRSRRPMRVATVIAAGALASCKLDLNPPPPPHPKPPPPSWRVVVWGSDDGTNDRVRRAIIAELLRRDLAGRIETGVHGADHVLSVSIEREVLPSTTGTAGAPFYAADETVTEGLDAALAPELSFRTDAPDPAAPAAAAKEPATALAWAIGDRLAHADLPRPATHAAAATPAGTGTVPPKP